MNVSVLSYNLLFSKALPNVHTVLRHAQPDIVCLQEIETTEENFQVLEDCGYTLGDYSNSFIKFGRVFGQATFFNKKTVSFVSSITLNLPQSYYEVALLLLRGVNDPRTVLKTEFRRGKSATFTIYNLHLSSFQATNKARAKQITEALHDLDLFKYKKAIITGDFNYPYGRKQFEKLIATYHLKEATNNLYYTSIFRFLKIIPMRLKVDYILFKGMRLRKTERLAHTFSDHFPIFSEFSL